MGSCPPLYGGILQIVLLFPRIKDSATFGSYPEIKAIHFSIVITSHYENSNVDNSTAIP